LGIFHVPKPNEGIISITGNSIVTFRLIKLQGFKVELILTNAIEKKCCLRGAFKMRKNEKLAGFFADSC